MTSQLNVDTIVDKAGSGGSNVKMANTSTYVSDGGAVSQNTVQGLAKCWFNFDQDALAVDDSLNISSITDTGTGLFDPQWNNNFANVNYACSGMTGDTFFISLDDGHEETVLTTTGDCAMAVIQHSGGHTDNEQTMVIAHGDLA